MNNTIIDINPTASVVACADQLFCKLRDNRKQSDIVLPETSEGILPFGEVISVGPDAADRFAVGDKIIFDGHAAFNFLESDRSFFISASCVKGRFV